MITHKEAVLWCDEGLAVELQGSTYIQGMLLTYEHLWMLTKCGVSV